MGNVILRVIGFVLTLFLGALIAGTIIFSHLSPTVPGQGRNVVEQANPGTNVMPVTLFSQPQKWQMIDNLSIVNDSFEVPRFRAWTFHIPSDGGSARRFTLTGQFGTDKPVRFAVVDQDNFTRLQSGYPFFAVYTAQAGTSFSTNRSPGRLRFGLLPGRGFKFRIADSEFRSGARRPGD
jgi:hypothetical protein